MLHENEIARMVVDTAYSIHSKLGPGLFESVYDEILCYELTSRGMSIRRQPPVPVVWKEIKLELGFRPDIIVEGKVLVELKSIDAIAPVHVKQVITYLKLTELKLGLLINFNEILIKDGIRRIVNHL
jgi:GxxExxY protein